MTTPFDKLLDAVEWQEIGSGEKPTDDGTPYATHEGILFFAGVDWRVYQLSTGERVIDIQDVEGFLDVKGD